jgi:histidyl-tRNA synthetase
VPLFQAPAGTRDILPSDSGRWRRFVSVFADVVEPAGYGQIILPMFEDLAVFQRVGESTDLVTKEMYDFEDKGGRRIALRPEQTASTARAYVEHRPTPPWKTWYAGPNFRYEKAQKGRYRQFDQVGIEVLGVNDPLCDVEVIALAWRFYEALGLQRVSLLLNSLGEADDRRRYIDALGAYLHERQSELTKESRETLSRNPLRVLDSKRAADEAVIAGAPGMVEFLSDSAAEHFTAVQSGLRTLGIPFVIAPRLVRGLDYYRHTTFEFAAEALDAAQNAVGGGGRYDGLVEEMGGPPTPGIGFALGVDRTLLACDAESVFPPLPANVDVWVVDTTDGVSALELTFMFRAAGLSADRSFDGRSMKAQMKAADRSGAAVAVIVGDDEIAAAEVTVRPLRAGGDQRRVARADVIEHVRKLIDA